MIARRSGKENITSITVFFMYGNTYLKLLFLVSLFRKHGLKKVFLVSLFPKQEPKKCVSCFLVSETHAKIFVSCFFVSETTGEKWCFLFPVSKQKQRNLIQLFRNKCFLPISGHFHLELQVCFRSTRPLYLTIDIIEKLSSGSHS